MHSSTWIKDFLRGFIPGPLLRARQSRRNRLRVQYGEQLRAVTGGKVFSGPFAGMRYVADVSGSALGPKLLGSYEAELHPVVGEVIAAPFDVIINVGGGEGYYAVGLLTRMARARALAFETDPRGQTLIRELAALNGVADRLAVHGMCGPDDLPVALQGAVNPLVVMDVEGAEEILLNPASCPALRTAAILVEVHEFLRPGVTARLLSWYEESHVIRRIPTASASETVVPTVAGLSSNQLGLLADEMRTFRMEWMYMLPRSGAC